MRVSVDGPSSDVGQGLVMELEQKIQMLERDLREHVKNWERFFAGQLRVPPEVERTRFAQRLRTLAEREFTRRADQFRVEQLQHRFMSYSQNWERMLREREEARAARDFAKADEIRDRLADAGIQIEDGADGTRWRRG